MYQFGTGSLAQYYMICLVQYGMLSMVNLDFFEYLFLFCTFHGTLQIDAFVVPKDLIVIRLFTVMLHKIESLYFATLNPFKFI